jgi:hypothetical protein
MEGRRGQRKVEQDCILFSKRDAMGKRQQVLARRLRSARLFGH